jgi:crotonobetainyl-CoA:carnitine CoA-transferase CaiB-like acyl-CoA transferase
MIAERLRTKSAGQWLAALEPAGVPCGPINDLAQVFDDPQVRHRGLEVSAPHPAAGDVRMVASPMRFSATPVTHDVAPPTLGQHTDEILASVLGFDAPRLEGLRKQGVI